MATRIVSKLPAVTAEDLYHWLYSTGYPELIRLSSEVYNRHIHLMSPMDDQGNVTQAALDSKSAVEKMGQHLSIVHLVENHLSLTVS